MAAEVTTAIFLDDRRALKDGTFPVKLRLTHKGNRKYYKTKYSFSKDDFENIQDPKARGKNKEVQLKLNSIETEAVKAIESLSAFSFNSFEKKYLSASANLDVFDAYQYAAEKFKSNGQIRNAQSYENACTSILYFINKLPLSRNKGVTLKDSKAKKDALFLNRKPLPFSEITSEVLKAYEKWMLLNGRSVTTIGIYLRTLRALFNEAISSGDIHPDLYPFGKGKYQIPAAKNIKKALTEKELDKILTYETQNEREIEARDYWIFSFHCNGMNMKDIAQLKYKNLQGDTLLFVRSKTERSTRHEQKKIEVILTPDALEIIQRWGNKPALSNTYIFPILMDGLTAEEEIKILNQKIKTINKYMNRIGKALGIEKNLSTYSARHSYSTFLKRSGASTGLISEALGHSSEKTTQNYLDSFENEVKRKFSSMLPGFKK